MPYLQNSTAHKVIEFIPFVGDSFLASRLAIEGCPITSLTRLYAALLYTRAVPGTWKISSFASLQNISSPFFFLRCSKNRETSRNSRPLQSPSIADRTHYSMRSKLFRRTAYFLTSRLSLPTRIKKMFTVEY
jgi:hypothetical protein